MRIIEETVHSDLINILTKLKEGQSFLMQKNVRVCRETSLHTGEVYCNVVKEDKPLLVIDKCIGSNLGLLHAAIVELENLLQEVFTVGTAETININNTGNYLPKN